ncbi:MAG: anaerobic ribonucleoside-triphosphate reductase activating protein [Candidatus Nomurabacteria bacterium]|nr:anaerobic ribonucleoside-triphosphate reductase activating protein [Candidatus Nomurabacteria bacterium]
MRIGGLEKFSLIDFPGNIACIIYTIGCKFACPYCHNPELVNETVEREIPVKEIYEFLESRKGLLEGVVITGGEPTLHDDLLEFISEIKKMGFKVKLDSNGTNPKMLKRAIGKKLVDYIAMDMKSPLEIYHKTVSRPVDIDAIKTSIELLMSSPIPYEFRTTIIKSLLSPGDIEQIAKEISGAKNYYLQKFVSVKILNPQFKKKVTYTDEEFSELRELAEKYVENCYVR